MKNLNFIYKIYSLLISIFLILFSQNAKAVECFFEIPKNSENIFLVNLKFDSSRDLTENFEKNFLNIKFDEEKLKYKKLVVPSENFLNRRSFKVEKFNSQIATFLTLSKRFKGFKNPEIISFEFKIKNNINACKTPVEVSLVNAESKHETILKSDLFLIDENKELKKCKLSNLKPDFGNLSPSFNPDILNYEIEVPNDVKNINFETETINKNLKVKINRKKLFPPEKPTDIIITVSNPNNKGIKRTYKVTVHKKIQTLQENELNHPKIELKENNLQNSFKGKTEEFPETLDLSEQKNTIEEKSDNNENVENNENNSEEEDNNSNENIEKLSKTQENIQNDTFKIYILVIAVISVLGLVVYLILKKYRF